MTEFEKYLMYWNGQLCKRNLEIVFKEWEYQKGHGYKP